MSIEADEEILQDFLVEAGEILELLSEELVDLEQRPDDTDLLNSIFRGFHTVKGGAGFLQLHALVNCCHVAENVFDILRNGQRKVDADLMDVVLQALDAVNEMFNDVRAGVEPTAADPHIMEGLNRLAKPQVDDVVKAPQEATPEVVAEVVEDKAEDAVAKDQNSEEITDEEFDKLLDAIDEPEKNNSDNSTDSPDISSDISSSGDITEEEFDQLLDDLHGKGKHSNDNISNAEDVTSDEASTSSASTEAESQDSDLITDSEFEDLLDRLHGEGGSPTLEHTTESSADTGEAKADDQPDAVTSAPVEASVSEKPEVVAEQAKPAAKPAAKTPRDAPAPVAETTVRVDTKRLDDIMNMVGELVLVRNRLVRLGAEINDESMGKAVANLDVVTGDLQTSVMKTRMQPIKKVFGRFPRVVRDLARQLKKEINLELKGEETDLDKNLVEALADPLVHLVRNSVDHGIEQPDERESEGKSRVGTIILAAEQEGDHIMLSIHDDGGGMDAGKLRDIAVNKGVMDQDAADRLSDAESYALIFAPGFSTKEEISDVSGRGVGMDVVKTKISQLNGTITIDSEMGKGTLIQIKVPLTLAIMPTLMVMLEDQAFAFPLVNVNEIFHLDLTQTNVVDGQEVVVVRDKPIPLFHLKRWLVKGAKDSRTENNKDGSGHVVVVSVGTQRVGFVVDQLVGQEEVVIKPLGSMLQGTAGMAGATITGDGRIALILDVPSMLKFYASQHSAAA